MLADVGQPLLHDPVLVFGIVKVAGYDEPEAAVFMGFDLAVIALLVRLGR